jgi:membrane protein
MKLPRPKEFAQLLLRTVRSWMRDNAGSMGAALAFYTLFTMAPLLMLVILLAGFFIGRDEAQALLMTQLSGLLGEAGAAGVKSVLNAAHDDNKGIVASIVGFVTLVLGATTVFAELRNDLDRIWQAKPPKSSGVWNYLRSRLLSFGMVATIGFLLLTSLVVSAALAYLGSVIGSGAILLYVLDFVASLAALTVLFAAIFKVLPSQRIEWRDVWVGSAMTALLFWVGKFLIGLYLGKSTITSEFGAAGTLVVAIAWVYYSSQVFFLGAEFTREYSLAFGTHTADAPGEALAEPATLLERARRVVTSKP